MPIRILLTIILCWFILKPFKLSAQVNTTDSLAVVDFFNSMGGYSKMNMPLDTWPGITVTNNRVTKIQLPSSGLEGSIPSSIGNLNALQVFDLSYDLITGTLPSSIGNLTQLQTFKIVGTINGNYTDTYLTGGIPPSFGNLINLQNLTLSLVSLDDTIPSSLGNLVNLQNLDLSESGLTGSIPTSFGNLINLQTLNIGYVGSGAQSLSGSIPSTLGNLKRLRVLNLSSNELSDSIPSSFGNLDSLQSLNLSGNSLTGNIPSTFGSLGGFLQSLNLSNNGLTGSIPVSISGYTYLQSLSLNTNHLNGVIPGGLSDLLHLTNLNLSNNALSDAIPSAFGNFDSLQTLYLNNNALTDSIPSSLSQLNLLTTLSLHNNQLTGNIPISFGYFKNISSLDMSYNRLTGNIPTTFSNDNALDFLNVSFNQLSGVVPALKVYNFYLNNNQFVFSGMEQLVTYENSIHDTSDLYAPQAIIPVVQQNGKLLVSVGGTPANNTYKWYDSTGTLVATIQSDSTFGPTVVGDYYVVVTNSIARKLTLYSDSVVAQFITMPLCSNVADNKIYSNLAGTNYQWQLSTDSINFNNINSNSNYSGVNSDTLSLKNIPSSWYGYQYRCQVNGNNSDVYTLKFTDTWTGAIDSTWEKAGNWSCDEVPDANTDVFINSGTPPAVLSSNTTIRSLTVSPSASFTIVSPYNLTITH